MSSMEERFQRLESRTAELEQGLWEMKARAEISDLMGQYALYWGGDCGERIADELWSASDQVTLEYGASGVYQSQWKIRTFYISEKVPGRLSTITFSAPLISLGEGRTTAWGIWTALGTETDAGDFGPEPVTEQSNRRVLFSSQWEGKQYRAEVLLQKYDVAFVLEAGGWKILHLHVLEYFRCPYDRDWVRYASERLETDGMWLESLFETPMPFPEDSHGENLPSTPSTAHWQYTAKGLPELLPDPLKKGRKEGTES